MNLAARFKILNGGLSTLDGTDGINCKLTGRGLQPKKSGAIYATTDPDVRASYDDIGAPVAPVFVEYRLIPGTPPPAPGTINWLSQYSVEVHYDAIHIDHQINWFRLHYNAMGFCKLDGADVPGSTGMALGGDEGKSGSEFSSGWMASTLASAGQRLSCGLEGQFRGVQRSGVLPTATMAEPFTVAGPGTFHGSFRGTNDDTTYTVKYTVVVHP